MGAVTFPARSLGRPLITLFHVHVDCERPRKRPLDCRGKIEGPNIKMPIRENAAGSFRAWLGTPMLPPGSVALPPKSRLHGLLLPLLLLLLLLLLGGGRARRAGGRCDPPCKHALPAMQRSSCAALPLQAPAAPPRHALPRRNRAPAAAAGSPQRITHHTWPCCSACFTRAHRSMKAQTLAGRTPRSAACTAAAVLARPCRRVAAGCRAERHRRRKECYLQVAVKAPAIVCPITPVAKQGCGIIRCLLAADGSVARRDRAVASGPAAAAPALSPSAAAAGCGEWRAPN
jgi:hypothetical protein